VRQPFTQIYVHLIWSTWDRLPLISPELREAIHACIQAECRELKADVLALGGVEDHVHLLVRLPTTLPVATLAKQVKGAPSHLVTHRLEHQDGFKWQGGLGALVAAV
jgi:REP element-mobilizing transposase RayT